MSHSISYLWVTASHGVRLLIPSKQLESIAGNAVGHNAVTAAVLTDSSPNKQSLQHTC